MYRRRTIGIFGGGLIVLAGIILVTLVYAVFTGQLNISNGSGVGRISKWDVHFEHLSTITTTHTAKVLTQPRLASGASIEDYSVSVTSPGDTISFTVDVVNDGNYNAELTSVSVGTPSCTGTDATSNTNVCNHLHYSLTYDSGASVQVGDTLYAKETNTMKVTLTYDDTVTASELPTQEVSISNLYITINYQQSGSALVKDNGEVADYKVYKQGDKITLNNEDYWVIEDSGAGQDYVVTLKDTPLTAQDIQNYKGDLTFTVSGNGMQYGTNSTYAGSYVETVVNNWESATFINDELKEINGYRARLITKQEYESISSINSWRYYSNYWYWTMTGPYHDGVNVIRNNGTLYDAYVNYDRAFGYELTVRPVINVYKDKLPS